MAVGAFGVGLTLISSRIGGRGAYHVYAVFDDATGLGARTRVQVAGIPIGQVDHIELDQATARAKVWLSIQKKYVLHKDASITKRSESILGDFLLDVNPGSPGQPPLQDGDEIVIVIKQPSMNDVFNSLNKIAGDISDMTGNLRKVLGGEEGEANVKTLMARLQRIAAGIERIIDSSGSKLDATLANFQKFSGDLSKISGGEKEDIVAIIQNTRDATAQARDILKTIGDVVGSGKQGELKESVKSLKTNLAKLDASLQNVQEITEKINKGEGTLGHLVNDDKLAKNLDRASSQLTDLLGGANSFQIEVNERTELLLGAPGGSKLDPSLQGLGLAAQSTAYSPWAKNYFGFRLIPKPDKWYGFELVDDPRGYTTLTKTQNNLCPVNPTTPCVTSPLFPPYVEQINTQRVLKFSVYIAKRYGPVSGRFGLIENTGGFGLKLHMLNDAFTVQGDIFEFANPLKPRPRLKLYADYRFMDHLLVTIGADDILNKPVGDIDNNTRIASGRDYFLGAGFFFTDDDLKKLIGLVTTARP